MNGFINLYKPYGITSNKAVLKIRKILGQKKIGHSGTLDPGATGVLVLGINKGTRLLQYLLDAKKQYMAEITFGIQTDTGDAFGNVIKEMPYDFLTKESLVNILPEFIGEIYQTPPMTSAIKVKGKKLYEFARKGEVIDRKPRKIKIYDLKLLSFKKENNKSSAILDITCSKGTYIRTLCEDIGNALNTVAFMSSLIRTKVGNFNINNAYTLEQIEEKFNTGTFDFIIPLEAIINNHKNFFKVYLDDFNLKKVLNGVAIPTNICENKEVALFTSYGKFVALGKVFDGLIKINKVFK